MAVIGFESRIQPDRLLNHYVRSKPECLPTLLLTVVSLSLSIYTYMYVHISIYLYICKYAVLENMGY